METDGNKKAHSALVSIGRDTELCNLAGRENALMLQLTQGARAAILAVPSRGLGRLIQTRAQAEAACQRWPAVASFIRAAWIGVQQPPEAA